MWEGKLLLSFGTVMFGIAFALSREAMSYLGPYSFNAIYSIVGCFALLLCRNPLKKLKPDGMTISPSEIEPFGSYFVRSMYPKIDPSTEEFVNLIIFAVPFGMLQFFANTLGQIGLVTIQVFINRIFCIACCFLFVYLSSGGKIGVSHEFVCGIHTIVAVCFSRQINFKIE
jgi:hypothetical protein